MAKQPDKKDTKKPATYSAFEDLTRKLLSVPKAELDEKVRLYESDKKKKKTK